jgi:hypothetical protein
MVGIGGVVGLSCVIDHILHSVSDQVRTNKIASPPQTKLPERRHLGIGVFKVPSSMISIISNRVIIEWLYEVDPDRAWDILVTQAQGLTLL